MRRAFLLLLLFHSLFFVVWADDTDFSDWDMDTLFNEPVDTEEVSPGEKGDVKEESVPAKNVPAFLLRKTGASLDASYYFNAGIAPGWNQAPWHWDSSSKENEYTHIVGLGMAGGMGLDVQISDVFRVKNSFGFYYPNFSLYVDQFFFDYTIKNAVFIRAGKYEPTWGISSNFPFTNLLARVPNGPWWKVALNSSQSAIVARADIPIGIGGLQVLALHRRGFIEDNSINPGLREIGYGAKYNLAFPWADIDVGAFFLAAMPLRAFISVKKTIKETELYTEGMTSVQHPFTDDHDTWDNWNFSANLGVLQDFFTDKLTVNAEVFYNGEAGSGLFRPKTDLREEEVSPFIGGLNTALNLRFRPDWFKDLRFVLQFLYAPKENTAQLVPGIRINPLPHMAVSLAVPMALGSEDGTYYSYNADKNNRPFSIVLLVSLTGRSVFGL
ncbi:hypothetical protein TREPR_2550 [Treponema primitia ZAS-2]|uniref:Lipoprotein n=1 Tax=Treponema primitia (strain ATCC BAA-887 / DSM 12427 / ZAS-2) TaxID=545694 RepID=F5YGM8_TREPZ|nr:hypothetical protein [Treponema primitia]AEF84459.1 hypothetical protein TREPR_2550 [Treponema primitia ZAS-2]